MIRMARVMSIDPAISPTVVSTLELAALIVVDIWRDAPKSVDRLGDALSGAMPTIGRAIDLADDWRALRIEPTVWWLAGPLAASNDMFARVVGALGDDGGATDLTGGFARIRIAGPDWRTILMFGGVFDAEDPAFGGGSTVGTMLHHMAVRYDVVAADTVDVFVAPSYASDLLHNLRGAVGVA